MRFYGFCRFVETKKYHFWHSSNLLVNALRVSSGWLIGNFHPDVKPDTKCSASIIVPKLECNVETENTSDEGIWHDSLEYKQAKLKHFPGNAYQCDWKWLSFSNKFSCCFVFDIGFAVFRSAYEYVRSGNYNVFVIWVEIGYRMRWETPLAQEKNAAHTTATYTNTFQHDGSHQWICTSHRCVLSIRSFTFGIFSTVYLPERHR